MFHVFNETFVQYNLIQEKSTCVYSMDNIVMLLMLNSYAYMILTSFSKITNDDFKESKLAENLYKISYYLSINKVTMKEDI